jgi:hypothetical protein
LAAAVLRAVRDADIRVADRVLISGSGLVADLAERTVRLLGGRVTRALTAEEGPSCGERGGPGVTGEFDVLVDTTADPVRWSRGFGFLRDQGRALLLLPLGSHAHPFDFYPTVHRRSLSVLARRLPAMNGSSDADRDAIRTAERLIQQGFLRAGGRLPAST